MVEIFLKMLKMAQSYEASNKIMLGNLFLTVLLSGNLSGIYDDEKQSLLLTF